MAKRWYYKDANGNKVPVPQYKINSDNHYTKSDADNKFATKEDINTKVAKTDIVQSVGNATDKIMSQKAVSDALSTKVGKTDITQSTGTSTTAVMSQKAVSDIVDKLESEVVYDVTANNDGVTFDSLSALLSDENLSTLIPTSVRHGGMTIRFVQSSNNNYVQYRLMKNTWSTVVSDWQGVDDVPTAGSDNLVKSGGVAKRIGDKVEPSLNWTNEQRIDAGNASDSKIVAAGTSFSITDYIEIIDGTIATAYGIQGYEGINSYPINFYDADKKWIGRSGDVKGEYCFNSIIPNSAVYVVLCQYITDEFPISGVKIVFEAIGDLATKEELEEKIKLAQEVKEDITQDDIDTISNSSYVVKNGSIVNDSALSASGSSFMLFKQNITAIEFTIGELWDTNRFELCFGYGYNNEQSLCNVGAVFIAPSDYFVLFTVGDDEEPGTILNDDARQIPIPIVSTGDRCMVEIVLDKYILGWVWDNINKEWKYWFMLNPTDTGAICNPIHTRLRYGWNERIGIGLSVVYASASAGLEMMKDVKILSRKGTNLEIYHNKVRMGRKFSNKKWLAIGDSITAYDSLNGWGYVGYTSRRNMLDTINCGNSGWGVCEVLQKHAAFAPYDEINVDWETAVTGLNTNDVVSIFLGTNDFYSAGRSDIGTVEPYRYPITLGTTDPTNADAKNPRTVLGALRLLIERLLAANPSVKIIVFAPFLRTDSADVYPVNSEGMTMREFSDAICDVAKEYGLEHYNMCDYAGVNTKSIAVLTNDNLHPNQKGGERLGEIIARWIN